MNTIRIQSRNQAHSWLKDAQFAAGVVVIVGGAAALLAEVAHLLA